MARAGFVDELHLARLNHLRGIDHPKAVATTYLALFNGDEELTGERPVLTLSEPVYDEAKGEHYCKNTEAITCTLANRHGSTVTGYGVCDQATDGNLLYRSSLYPFGVEPGQEVTIPSITLYAHDDK